MIVGIYDPYLDDLGGGEKYMMTIAQCLSKKNDVDVFWDNEKDLETLKNRFSLDLSNVKIVPNVFSNTSFLKRLTETRKYDCLIVLSDGSVPLVLSKLFLHVQQPLSQFQNTTFKDKIKLSRVSKIFCNSNYTENFISKNFDLKTTVIYPPVKLYPKKVQKENIILHVGRFRVKDVRTIDKGRNMPVGDYKKQGVMIDTFREMVDAGLKNWKFVIATSIKDEDKKDFERLKDTAKNYPIEFLINKKNNELWDIYSKAKIYWHASGYGEDLKKYPELAEHFGISTVEAMGAGAVPVVIEAGGQREIVENGKNGFLWTSLSDLKKETIRLMQDKKLLEKISNQAKERAQYFSDQKFCERINDLILG